VTQDLTPYRVIARRQWNEGLFSLTFDQTPSFRAGQFISVAISPSAPRRERRPYSIASAPGEPLELLIVTVPGGWLSPQLANLRVGDTLYGSNRGRGLFTLDPVPEGRELWLVGTGTGFAPYRSMLRDTSLWMRYPKVHLAMGVRSADQMAYADEVRALGEARPEAFRSVLACSQEAPSAGSLSGRITHALEDGSLERAVGGRLHPDFSSVLLCGNPSMIADMTRSLEGRGFRRHLGNAPGQILTERYW
jgi:ferredoxin--NADP+ reductase